MLATRTYAPLTTVSLGPTALAALALLCLAAPPAAHAQTLTLSGNDNVTVSSAGTHGMQGGMTVNNGTVTYFEVNAVAVTTGGNSVFTLQNGGSVGSIMTDGLDASGAGSVTITGGTVSTADGDALAASGATKVTISGGSIEGGSVVGLADSSSGAATVTGGTFSGGVAALENVGSAAVTVAGGTFSSGAETLDNEGSGSILVTGGNISSSDIGLVADSGVIDLFSQGGAPFLIDGTPMNNTTVSGDGQTIIMGTLLNGDPLDTKFGTSGGILELNVGTPPAVPEPSALAPFALAVAGLLGLRLRARRKIGAA